MFEARRARASTPYLSAWAGDDRVCGPSCRPKTHLRLTAKFTVALTARAATMDATSQPVSHVNRKSAAASTKKANSEEPANSARGSITRTESKTGRKWLEAL